MNGRGNEVSGGLVLGLLLLVATVVPAEGALEVGGRWLFERDGHPPEIGGIVQTGSAIEVTVPSIGLDLAGTINASPGFQVGAGYPDCPRASLTAQLFPDGGHFVGYIYVASQPDCALRYAGVRGTRCECFDGNAAGGDGCDARCQLEPCFTCTGVPSACVPSPAAAACDDRDPCTVGETCSAGACGGGSPRTPCVNLTGRWLVVPGEPGSPPDVRLHYDFRQSGTLLDLDGAWARIDPETGIFFRYWVQHATNPLAAFLCPDTILQFRGQGTPDGRGLSMLLPIDATTMRICTWQALWEGSRCGGGRLDAGETCDDADRSAGDGCDVDCRIEPGFVCAGEPSVCRRSCDDGNPCTGDDRYDGAVCRGTPVVCDACSTCDAGAGGCVAAPAPACTRAEPGLTTFDVRAGRRGGRGPAIVWRWGARNGAAPDFGDRTATGEYALCAYDRSGLVFRARVPAGGECDGAPCWTAIGSHALRYRNGARTPEGVGSMLLATIPGGGAGAIVRGRGRHLFGRPYGLSSRRIALPLVVQLHAPGGACLEAEYGTDDVLLNARGAFRAIAR